MGVLHNRASLTQATLRIRRDGSDRPRLRWRTAWPRCRSHTGLSFRATSDMASKTPPRVLTMADPGFHKEDFPFYWIARINAIYAQEMEQALKTVGLDVTMWRVLAILGDQGACSMSEVAMHAVGKLPTITKMVYRMRDEGWVSTRTADHDARVTEVQITEAGRAVLQRAMDATGGLFRRCFNSIPPGKLERLNEMLQQLLRNLQS